MFLSINDNKQFTISGKCRHNNRSELIDLIHVTMYANRCISNKNCGKIRFFLRMKRKKEIRFGALVELYRAIVATRNVCPTDIGEDFRRSNVCPNQSGVNITYTMYRMSSFNLAPSNSHKYYLIKLKWNTRKNGNLPVCVCRYIVSMECNCVFHLDRVVQCKFGLEFHYSQSRMLQ